MRLRGKKSCNKTRGNIYDLNLMGSKTKLKESKIIVYVKYLLVEHLVDSLKWLEILLKPTSNLLGIQH